MNHTFNTVINNKYLLINICDYLDSIYDLIVFFVLNREIFEFSQDFGKHLLKETIVTNNLKRLISHTVNITYDSFINIFFNKFNLVLSGSSILWCICGPKWGFCKNCNIKYENTFQNYDNDENYITYPDDFDFYINCDYEYNCISEEDINIPIYDLMGELKSINFYIDASEYGFTTKEIFTNCKNIYKIINGLTKQSKYSSLILKYKLLLMSFLNELQKIINMNFVIGDESFTWNDCNMFFNILYSYRYILIKFESELNMNGSYELFGKFPVLKLREEKGILNLPNKPIAKIQIIFNTNHKIKFDNYDFDFLKSYVQYNKNNKKLSILFNNSIKSIIKRNENNTNKIYRHISAFHNTNPVQVLCCLSSFSILYLIKYNNHRKKQYIQKLAFYIAQSIYRKMKYSSRGFNCLNIDTVMFDKFNLSVIYNQYFNHQSKSMRQKGITMLMTKILIYDRNVLIDNFYCPLYYYDLKLL